MNTTAIPRRRAALALAAAAAAIVLTACGNNDHSSNTSGSGMGAMPGMSHTATTPTGDMPGMGAMTGGNGLSATAAGMTLTPATTALSAGQDSTWTFRILGSDGKAVTGFEPEQTKLMHLYLIRDDLTGFQHLHPSVAADGTWMVTIAAPQPGSYRAYTQFTVNGSDGKPVTSVLSVPVTVAGTATPVPLPPATPTTMVDGYTLTVASVLTPGRESDLSLTVSKDGQPVTDLQPYLDTYAHLTAIHAGDLAFAHLHPQGAVDGDHGGPKLDFHAMLPTAGDWRLFVQFQTGGTLHTAATTVHV